MTPPNGSGNPPSDSMAPPNGSGNPPNNNENNFSDSNNDSKTKEEEDEEFIRKYFSSQNYIYNSFLLFLFILLWFYSYKNKFLYLLIKRHF